MKSVGSPTSPDRPRVVEALTSLPITHQMNRFIARNTKKRLTNMVNTWTMHGDAHAMGRFIDANPRPICIACLPAQHVYLKQHCRQKPIAAPIRICFWRQHRCPGDSKSCRRGGYMRGNELAVIAMARQNDTARYQLRTDPPAMVIITLPIRNKTQRAHDPLGNDSLGRSNHQPIRPGMFRYTDQ